MVDGKENDSEIPLLVGKPSAGVIPSIIEALEPDKDPLHPITFDDGKAFMGHEKISGALGVSCYFVRPYHSWERGLNENTHGLIRQYFPKGTHFLKGSQEPVHFVQNALNNRPRKLLDDASPAERVRQTISISGGCSVSPFKPLGVQNSNIVEKRKLKSAVALMT